MNEYTKKLLKHFGMEALSVPVVFFEETVESNGSAFVVMYGKHINGGFCAIPNWKISCEMSNYDDVSYNAGKLLEAGIPKKYVKDIANAICKFGKEPYEKWVKENHIDKSF